MFKRIKKQLKTEQGGVDTVTFVMTVLMTLLLLCALLDIARLGWKFNAISQLNTNIARTASVQGGFRYSRPDYFPGHYITMYDLENMVTQKMTNADVQNGEWYVRFSSGGSLGTLGRSQTPQIDYKDSFSTEIGFDYSWDFLNALLPGNPIRNQIHSTRPGMSEWKYDYENWIGE